MRVARILIVIFALSLPLKPFPLANADVNDYEKSLHPNKVKTNNVVSYNASDRIVGYNVIVNKNVPVRELTVLQLRAIFSYDLRFWSNGKRITVVTMEDGSPHNNLFMDSVLHSSLQSIVLRQERSTRLVRGTINVITVPSRVEMFKAVSSTPNSIGFLPNNISIYKSDPIKIVDVKREN